MKTYSVSTLLTAAVMATGLPSIIQAQVQATSPQQVVLTNPDTLDYDHHCKPDPKSPGCVKLMKDRERKRSAEADKAVRDADVTLGDCKTLHDELLSKANNEYRKACTEADPIFRGLVSIIGKPEFLTCAGYIEQCANPTEAASEEDDDDDDDRKAGVGAAANRRKGGSSAELKELMEQARMCSVGSGSEYKEARESLKEYEKDRAKLEEKQRDSQNEMMEIAQEQKSASNKLDDRAEQIRLQFAAKQREILTQKTNKENQIAAAVVQIEAEAEEMRISVDRIRLAQVEADIALAEALGQIERQCHAEALAKVEVHRRAVLDQIKSSTFSPGGQSNLFQGIGSSMKAKFKKLASEYFKDCKGSDITKELVRASKNRKALAVAKAEAEIQGMNSKIDRAKAKIKELQTKDRTAVLQEATDNLTALQEEVLAAGKKLDNNRTEIGSEAGMKMTKAQMKSANIGADLDRKSADMADDQAAASIGRRIKLPTNSKGDEIGKAKEEFYNIKSVALRAATQCCAPKADWIGPGDRPPSDSARCKSACAKGYQRDSGWSNINCEDQEIGSEHRQNSKSDR